MAVLRGVGSGTISGTEEEVSRLLNCVNIVRARTHSGRIWCQYGAHSRSNHFFVRPSFLKNGPVFSRVSL